MPTTKQSSTKAEHTPGPWEADDGEGYSIWSIRAKGQVIARVIGDSAETDANARLIAAAPELLAEAEAIGIALNDLPEYLRKNGHEVIGHIVAGRLKALRSVIAKAKGGAA